MKIEIEIDDTLYNRLEELLSTVGLSVENITKGILEQAVLFMATYPDEIIKASSSDASLQDKAKYTEILMEMSDRMFKRAKVEEE